MSYRKALPPLAATVVPDTPDLWRYLYLKAGVRSKQPRPEEISPNQVEAKTSESSVGTRRGGSKYLGGFAPWLDRTSAEERIRLTPQHIVHSAAKRVALDQASRVSVLKKEAIQENLQTLSRLVPSFAYSQSQLSCTMLVRLAEDVEGVFSRLAELRAMFPDSSITSMLSIRPELLIQEAFLAVPVGVTRLQALFPGADIPRVVERQPYLLLPNCEELLDELLQGRLLPEALGGYKGKEGAAHQVERILTYVQSSTIQATLAYRQQRKRIVDSCARAIRARPWEEGE